MERGRKRKPDALHQLQGTYREDRHGDLDSKCKPNQDPPDMPSDFDDDFHAKKAWDFIVQEHVNFGIQSKSYQLLMEKFCRSYTLYRDAFVAMKEHGVLIFEEVYDKSGTSVGCKMKRNPAGMEYRSLSGDLAQMLPELGLTPSALAKINMPASEDNSDPFGSDDDPDPKAIAGKVGEHSTA